MDLFRASEEHVFGLGMVRIRDAAVDRADGGALFLIEVTDALGAFARDDVVEIIRNGVVLTAFEIILGSAGLDGGVRALGFAGAAVDAFFGDLRSHGVYSSKMDSDCENDSENLVQTQPKTISGQVAPVYNIATILSFRRISFQQSCHWNRRHTTAVRRWGY